MARPSSLLNEANAFARDYPRDRMPDGYMWDMVDFVPVLLDAQLTGRGAWKWASAVAPEDFVGGIHALYEAGDKLLLVDAAGAMHDVHLTTGALGSVGAVGHIVQNPVQHRDNVYVPNSDGTAVKQVKYTGTFALADLPATAPKARYGVVYKDRLLLGNFPGEEQRIVFSPPGDPMAAWDSLSYFNSSLPLTGLASLRAITLLFHAGSVERVRGAIPPSQSDPLGDMFMEPLYDRAGCGDARSIAYWNDNCVFADERGVHFTDGAIVRNLASQGNILTLWRTLYRDRSSIAADTYLDYYIVTVIRATDNVAITLVCDLNRRTWFRLNNIRSRAYVHSVGMQEQLWGCRDGAKRLISLGNCFFPTFTALQVDDDGTAVLPAIETPWTRLGEEGRKRVRFAYLSYDARVSEPVLAASWRGEPDSEGLVIDPFEAAQAANGSAKAALVHALELGYITSPHETDYSIAGRLPETSDYSRFKLPLGKNPYGVAFRIRQLIPSYVTRVYGLQVEAQAEERSRA